MANDLVVVFLSVFLTAAAPGCGGGQKKIDAGMTSSPRTDRDSGPRPSWIDTPPGDDGYFHGVGQGEERQTAQDNALRNLAASIKVTVKGETRSVFKEKGEMAGEDYEASVETMVDTTLSGVKYDLWQDQKSGSWWAHAYLSKADFWRPRDEARKVAEAYYARAASMMEQGRLVEALKLYVQSLAALGKYWALPFEVDTKNGRKIFQLAVEDELMDLASKVKLKAVTGIVKAKVGSPVKEPLRVQALANDTALAGLPLRFGFEGCKGKVESSVQTNERGLASARITSFLGGARQCRVKAGLDLGVLFAGVDADEQAEVRLAASLKRVGFPEVYFPVATRKLKVAVIVLDQDESGKSLGESHLQAALSEALRKHGYQVTTRAPFLCAGDITALLEGDGTALKRFRERKIDVLVVGKVTIRVRKGTAAGDPYGLGETGLVLAKGRALVQALEVSSGSVLAKIDYPKIIGRGFTKDKALSLARMSACKAAGALVKEVNQHLMN